jgi:hypothetical protein
MTVVKLTRVRREAEESAEYRHRMQVNLVATFVRGAKVVAVRGSGLWRG